MRERLTTATGLGVRAGVWKRAVDLLFGSLLLIGVLSCSEPVGQTQSHGGPVIDHVSFVDALRREGYAVEIAGEVQQPFLRAKGTRLRIRGVNLEQPEELQSYDYENEAAAKADANRIEPDGMPTGARIDWMAPPHFFLRGRVLVIYVGSKDEVVGLLTDMLGPQFAGR